MLQLVHLWDIYVQPF